MAGRSPLWLPSGFRRFPARRSFLRTRLADDAGAGYHLRDFAADAAALAGTLGAVTAHLGGVGAWPTAEPFWAVAGRAEPHNDLRRRERGGTTSSRPRPGGAEGARTD